MGLTLWRGVILVLCCAISPAYGDEAEEIAALLSALKNGFDGRRAPCPDGIDRLSTSYENEIAIGMSYQASLKEEPYTLHIFPVDFIPTNVSISAYPLAVTFSYKNENVIWGDQNSNDFDHKAGKTSAYAQISPFLAFYSHEIIFDFTKTELEKKIVLPFPTDREVFQSVVELKVSYIKNTKGSSLLVNRDILVTFSSLIPGQTPFAKIYNTGEDATIRLICSNLEFVYIEALAKDKPNPVLEPAGGLLTLKTTNTAGITFRERE